MKATDFEFRYRALLIAVVYWLAFSAYSIDHTNAVRAVVTWTMGPSSPRGVEAAQLWLTAGALLVVIGAWVRTWGAAYLQASIVHDAKLHSTVLVADGPYRYVRHPLYFGSIIAAIGIAFMASRLGFLILVGAQTLLYLRLMGREEAHMQEQIGKAYREFCRRVPRLWPSLTPRASATGAKPRWGQALWGEAFMWGFAIAIGTFAVTLDVRIAGLILGVSLLALAQQQFVHNRRRAAGSGTTAA